MSDHRARLEVLDELESPDLWPDVLRIEPSPEEPAPPSRRWGTLVVALVVGAAAVALAVIAFSGARPKTETPGSTLTPTPVENGPIWALGAGGEGGSLIYAVDPATGQKTPLWTDGPNTDFPSFPVARDLIAAHYDYAFSPDGTRVAFTGYAGTGSADCCTIELFVMNADGSGLAQLTHDNAYNSFPSWSPDGKELVFASYRGNHYVPGCPLTRSCPADLYVIGADGTGEHQLTSDAADEATPTWSPDGTKIAYIRAEGDSRGALWVMNADGTGAQNLIAGDGGLVLLPEWSPDGSQILYLSAAPNERFGVWVANADGTDPHQLIDTNADTTFGRPVWSPDGSMIAYAKLVNGEPQLWVITNDGSQPHLVAELPRYGLSPLAWQPVTPPPPNVDRVVSVQLVPIPEGPYSPLFALSPKTGEAPLAKIRSAIPHSLPSPIDQSCTLGGDVVIRLEGGRTIRYGPCQWPPSILRLKAAMLRYLENHHA